MMRDMDVVKKVLLAIEENYKTVALFNYDLKIDGLDMETTAYHCKILHDGGFVSDYKAQFADGHIYLFRVGSLTWEGHDFLDKIRDDSTWAKTKETIKSKGLPMTLDAIKTVANGIIKASVEAAMKSIIGS